MMGEIMKRIFVSFIIISCVITFIGCHQDNSEKFFTMLTFKYTDNKINAISFYITDSIKFEGDVLYTTSDNSVSNEQLFPRYIFNNTLILSEIPTKVSNNYKYIKSDNKTIWYNQYLLKQSDGESETYKWNILCDSEIKGEVELLYNDKIYNPVSFFVKDDYVYIFCMNDIDSAVFIYDIHLSDPAVYKVISYTDKFKKFNIPEPVLPYYAYNYNNVYSYDFGFIYNDGVNIYLMDPDAESMTILFNEQQVLKDMPFIDSYREDYIFFIDCAYQNGYYLLSFPAYNILPGWYVVIYDSNCQYSGYLHLSQDRIEYYDFDNKLIDSINVNILPKVYINM